MGSIPSRVKAPGGQKVAQLALGAYHSGCTTDQGLLYTWGHGEYGQLGHGDARNKSEPTPVKALRGRKVVQLALGTSHSACTATEDGVLYTWGDGEFGKLGTAMLVREMPPRWWRLWEGRQSCSWLLAPTTLPAQQRKARKVTVTHYI